MSAITVDDGESFFNCKHFMFLLLRIDGDVVRSYAFASFERRILFLSIGNV